MDEIELATFRPGREIRYGGDQVSLAAASQGETAAARAGQADRHNGNPHPPRSTAKTAPKHNPLIWLSLNKAANASTFTLSRSAA